MKRLSIIAIILIGFGFGIWILGNKPEQRIPSSAGPAAPVSVATPVPGKPASQKNPGKNSAAAPEVKSGQSAGANDALKDWTQTRDPFTGKVRAFSGQGLSLPGTDEKEKADAFIAGNAKDLFGVPAENLAFEKASKAARTKIIYQQMLGGFPVYGSTLALLFERNELTRVQNDLQSDASLPGRPDWKFEEVFEIYKQKPNGGLRAQALISDVRLAKDPALMPRLMLYPASQGLIFVYQFYVDETSADRAPARAMVLFDPAGSRVVQKTNLHIE